MKMKRFCAPDIRQAMRLVREELGPDAVILSNRNIDEGIEIVAAMDFDQDLIYGKVNESIQSAVKEDKLSLSKDKHSPELVNAVNVVKSRPAIRKSPRPKKVHQSNVKPVSKPENTAFSSNKANDSEINPIPGLKKTKLPVESPAQPSIEPVLEEMRKEFDQMRELLNTHMSDLSWTESVRLNPVCREVLHRLNALGFSESISKKIIKQMDVQSDFTGAWEKIKRSVSRHLKTHDDNLIDYGGIVALVGPTGVGKTTTIAKIAAKFRLKYGARQIGLVTADNYRIAAHEQLYTYGRILDIPVRTAHDNAELEKVLNEFIDKRLVLIDTAGMSQRDVRLAEQFPLLRSDDFPIRSYLVMSAATQTATMNEIIEAFKIFNPHAGILTKLDETVTIAAAISALIENQLPLSFLCDGQKVPENIRSAKGYGLAKKCFSSSPVKMNGFRSPGGDTVDQRIQAYG